MKDHYRFDVKKERPEELFESVLDYFKGKTLTQYATSKSMMRIQEKITIRALELLDLNKKAVFILDMGCGPGFSSIYLNELGYNVVALDIISDFIYFYDNRELKPIITDMCLVPFRSNIFDAIISISALQWIYKEINNETMRKKFIKFTQSIEIILKPESKAVFQFYPKNDRIMKDIGAILMDNTRMSGNFIIDNPNNPKKRKIYLLLEN